MQVTNLVDTVALIEQAEQRHRGPLLNALRLLSRNPKIVAGLAILLLFVLMALAAPLLTPYPPDGPKSQVAHGAQPPSHEHILGTTSLGQDMFSQIAYGARVSLLIGFVTVTSSTALQVIFGLSSAYFGGLIDEALSLPLDFLGVNYYSRMLVRGASPEPATATSGKSSYEVIEHIPGASYTDMGWEIFPEGLEAILTRLHREYAPKALVVTENGAAFEDHWHGGASVHDWQRLHYLQLHIEALSRALSQQVPLKGYMVWSLLDNFEWAFGYSKRFGLVYVDYSTQRRIIKDSGRWYASFIAAQHR